MGFPETDFSFLLYFRILLRVLLGYLFGVFTWDE